jgi:cyclopropane-fatty-acyl-phospholipid synthase
MSVSEQRRELTTSDTLLARPGQGSAMTSLLRRFLPPLEYGRLTIELPDGARIDHRGTNPGPDAVIVFHRWRTLWRSIIAGEIGFAESYMDGDCSSPDIPSFLHLILMNDRSFQIGGGVVVSRLVNRLRHVWRANTPRGSRRNIAAHYDLGNDFYSAWLDAGMNYSSAIFAHPNQSLEEAQIEKLARITELLDLHPGQHVLEIGCGWGALAERILSAQCNVTGLTLSSEQLAFAKSRIAAAPTRSDLRLQDYRHVEGQFDRIVSVEMIEAVGEKYWPAYFSKLRDCLKPGGIAVLQAITIEEHRFDDYRARPDFIQRYIFPGGMLPTMEAIQREIEHAGMTMHSVETFGESYARTLSIWRDRFLQAWPQIEALGFDVRFKRMWEYYLAYCEAGFREKAISVGLVTFQRA